MLVTLTLGGMPDESALEPADIRSTDDLVAQFNAAMKAGDANTKKRLIINALSGLVPYFGGVISGAAGVWSEANQGKVNDILLAWMKLKEQELAEIGKTLSEVLARLDTNDPKVEERARSPEYASLLRRAFRDWSAAESEEKRVLVRNILIGAAGSRLCSDDVLKQFLQWVNLYSEAHFKIVRTIYKYPRATRAEIWDQVDGADVREDSAEADLFKLYVRDLSTGGLIRQVRQTDSEGRFLKKVVPKNTRAASRSHIAKSAFDQKEEYVLTALGQQFVHYAMTEDVVKISAPSPSGFTHTMS
jgi:hypothetical protein